MAAVRERVTLARQVDILELKTRRTKCDIGWLKKSAKEMDILVDDMSDFSEGDMYDSDDGRGSVERTKERRALQQKRDHMRKLLSQPIFPKGFSYKFPTSSAPLTPSNLSSANGQQSTNQNEEKTVSQLSTDRNSKDNAVTVMKNAIEEYKVAKKQRNKKSKY